MPEVWVKCSVFRNAEIGDEVAISGPVAGFGLSFSWKGGVHVGNERYIKGNQCALSGEYVVHAVIDIRGTCAVVLTRSGGRDKVMILEGWVDENSIRMRAG